MNQPTLTHLAEQLRASLDRYERSGQSDRELLDRFTRNRDEDAFATLVRRHSPFVLAACRQVLTEPADIDDAFQATFLVLLRKARSVNWQRSLGSWLYAVAHRVAVHARADARRRQDRETRAAEQRRAVAASAAPSWREACAVLHEELDRLPERYRLPLLLCYLEGQSRDEAAKNLGWTAGAVKGCLERGRQMLARRLTRRGITLSAGLLVVVTRSSAAAAGLPPQLLGLTVRAATGGAGPAVAALVQGVSPMILASKKMIASVLVLLGFFGAGVGLRQSGIGAPADPPAVIRAPARLAQPDAGARPTGPEQPGERTAVGRVLDPDGKPVASKEDAVKRELEKAQGKWKLIKIESSGTTDDKGSDGIWKLEIKGDRCIFIVVADGKERKDGELTFKCDPSQKPKTVDVSDAGGTVTPFKGIYELEGDSLKLRFDVFGSRPKDFASKEAFYLLMIWEREKR